jgi:plastocyanin
VTADDGAFRSDRLGSGATFSQTFAKAGTFAYHCAIHPGMTGTVTVH